MKSSTGKYYIGLDHLRAIAAYLVFSWHFLHESNGHHAPPPIFPLSFLTEGHTGVALFMALSGYLFAKLLDGKQIRYRSFIWNRVLRLLPLLILVVIVAGIRVYQKGDPVGVYVHQVLMGWLLPTLPNGGWSITVEFHFYLLLPLLLYLSRRWKHSLLFCLAGTILFRLFLHLATGSVAYLSYWTIVGRIDQFMLGILAYQYRDLIKGRHGLISVILLLYAAFFWYIDHLGGMLMNHNNPAYVRLMIVMPTAEGLAYAALIAWYDLSFVHSTGRISRFLAQIGNWSYSIYLLHAFMVFRISRYIHHHLIDMSNVYVAMLLTPIGFLLILPVCYLSYRFVELPFLRFRVKYVIGDKPRTNTPAAPVAVAESN